MKVFFQTVGNPYSLRNEMKFNSRNIRTVRYENEMERASSVVPRTSNSISSKVKESASLEKFNAKIER